MNKKYECILEENKELKQQIEKLMNLDKQREYQQNKDISSIEYDEGLYNSKEELYEEDELENNLDLE